jgi:dihydroorotate dehydrogenase
MGNPCNIAWYRWVIRPWLFRLPPEWAHRLTELALSIKPVWRFNRTRFRIKDRILSRDLAGIYLSNPIGLAPGFDKQCKYLDTLSEFGFGYLVGGTVTPERRPGNQSPRLLRRTSEKALVNSLGFPSDGLSGIATRLEKFRPHPVPIIVSIAALDVEGFLKCHRILEPLVEAIELNISSPNTEGIKRFQEPRQLFELLERINEHREKPIFVKMPPFLDEAGRGNVMEMLRQCVTAGVTGLTAINSIPVIESRLAAGRGGLSGQPIFEDMLSNIRELRREAGQALVINACGGISNGRDAITALEAGADTVQLYTAMVYQGPGVVRNIADEMIEWFKNSEQNKRKEASY